MSPELPDDAYLRWLYRQVASVSLRDPSRTYWSLFRHLYQVEFLWHVANDDNRVEDGRALRYEFISEQPINTVDDEWMMGLPCSVLEMLVALSRRCAFEADGTPRAWFWHILHNIELHELTDDKPYPEEDVDEIISRVIWRTYAPDGRGGLFPLKNADRDQRKVEIWYQLAAYLLQD